MGEHLREHLREIARQAQYLVDIDGDRIPPHVLIWMRDLITEFG